MEQLFFSGTDGLAQSIRPTEEGYEERGCDTHRVRGGGGGGCGAGLQGTKLLSERINGSRVSPLALPQPHFNYRVAVKSRPSNARGASLLALAQQRSDLGGYLSALRIKSILWPKLANDAANFVRLKSVFAHFSRTLKQTKATTSVPCVPSKYSTRTRKIMFIETIHVVNRMRCLALVNLRQNNVLTSRKQL